MRLILTAALVLSAMGFGLGAILIFASKRLHVAIDERIEKVENALPAANCGACGFVGCGYLAEAVIAGEARVDG